MTARIGHLELGDVPRVAVPLLDEDPRRDAADVKDLADLIEIRIDGFTDLDPAHAVQVVREMRDVVHHELPIIATVRADDEGGRAPLSDDERGALYDAVLPFVDAVDIEIRAALRDRIVDAAHVQGRTAIVSYHDFDETPPEESLHQVLETGRHCGAAIVKIATAAQSPGDVVRLLEFTLQHRDKNLVTIAMGEAGAISRVFFPLAGSLITYAHHRVATGPGQLSLQDLHAELRRYYPGFAQEAERRGRAQPS